MAITYGPIEQHQRVGIDIVVIAESDVGITYDVHWYVQSIEWGFSDSQTLTIGGSTAPAAINFTFSAPSGSTTLQLVFSRRFSASKVYGGGPTHTFTGAISGQYLGGTPSHSRSFTIPARPPDPPNKVLTPTVSSITATKARVNWVAPAINGAALNGYQLQLATNPSFSGATTYSSGSWATYRDLTGLTRATDYWVRVRARNSAGYGLWSEGRKFTTSATVPDRPDAPTVSDIEQDGVTLNWSAPANGGSALNGYQLRVDTSSSFTNATTHTGGVWRTTHNLVNLAPDATYYVQLRVKNSVGYSSWSTTRSFTTKPGVRARVGGAWVNVEEVRLMVGGVWVAVELRKRVNGAWVS